MRKLIILTTTGLALFAGALSLAVPSHAAPAGSLHSAQALAVQGEAAGTSDAAGSAPPTGTSSPSATPSGNLSIRERANQPNLKERASTTPLTS